MLDEVRVKLSVAPEAKKRYFIRTSWRQLAAWYPILPHHATTQLLPQLIGSC